VEDGGRYCGHSAFMGLPEVATLAMKQNTWGPYGLSLVREGVAFGWQFTSDSINLPPLFFHAVVSQSKNLCSLPCSFRVRATLLET